MKINKKALAVIMLLWLNFANAGTKVLDVEISVSTVDQVKSSLASKTKVVDAGINKYSQ